MNENIDAILQRDYLDCKQKCLTEYLTRNNSLFEDKLPPLKSFCCCRHLNNEKKCDEKISHKSCKRSMAFASRSKRSQKTKLYSSESVINEVSVDNDIYYSSGFRAYTGFLSSTSGVNSNKQRIPSVILTTSNSKSEISDIIENSNTTPAQFKEPFPLASTKKGECFSHGREVSMEYYVNQNPQTLVCNSRETEDRNDQLTERPLRKDGKYTTHLNNHTNYENITIQSLLDFNIVHFGKS